uniref:Fibronectin type III domain-containing protein n=1 Tax=Echinococcus granulosus TaxID=6210 RepID=A0A068W9U4_ECHGR|nr:fibronectin type III domain-containing protein [Echinococcus granulosus]
MSHQLHLIVLATSLLVGSCRGVGEDTKINYTLPEHFYWSRLGSTVLELRWDVTKMGEEPWYYLVMTAEPISSNASIKTRNADFEVGNITFVGLEPNTSYRVIIESFGGRENIFLSGTIRTLPTVQGLAGNWSKATVLELRWDVTKMGEEPWYYLVMTAEPISSNASIKTKKADFEVGKSTFVGLEPNTSYRVIMESFGGRENIFLSGTIRTLPTGVADIVFTSGGAAFISVISGLVVAFTVVILA